MSTLANRVSNGGNDIEVSFERWALFNQCVSDRVWMLSWVIIHRIDDLDFDPWSS